MVSPATICVRLRWRPRASRAWTKVSHPFMVGRCVGITTQNRSVLGAIYRSMASLTQQAAGGL